MLVTILAFAVKIVLALATLFGIYRGVTLLRQRNEGKSVPRFLDARNAVKQNREALRRRALGAVREKSTFLNANGEVPLLLGQDWLLPAPIPLESVKLRFGQEPWPKVELPWQRLPIRDGIKYKQYSDAISKLDPPSEFKNRIQYRLLEINGDSLSFSPKPRFYFDKINYGEYLMLEFARNATGHRKWLLNRLREPADYMVLAGISTLTLIHDGIDLRLLMHLRGQNETAYAMGTYHVIPAGEFQPSCLAPSSFKEDFDLWKNIMREYAEELLGMEEYDGDSTVPFSYSEEPFLSLEREKAANNIKVFYLGTGLDVITFQGEILTVAVFKEQTFNKIFSGHGKTGARTAGGILKENREGKIITDNARWGRPFTQEEYDSYQVQNVLATGEAILNIAWRNKEVFKSCFA
jgi:hypothetical protein